VKIFIVFGTRPEAIKLAPLVHKLKDRFDVRVVSTGQHLEMLGQVIRLFKIVPDYEFGCMTVAPDLDRLDGCIHGNMRLIIDTEDPDLIIVQGDTLTAYSSSFIGFMRKKPVFHVEAGLRTHKKFSPYPEEILRTLICKLADFHFAPTQAAKDNLLSEGVREDRILLTGNTVVDALFIADSFIDEESVLKELSSYNGDIPDMLKERRLILITTHRRESLGEPMRRVCDAINTLAKRYADAVFLLPVHKNPDVRRVILERFEDDAQNVVLTEHLSYDSTLYLMKRSYIVMTDSGGIQEEAPTFGKPIIVLREVTERPEIIEAGIGFLAGTNPERITEIFSRLYEDEEFYKQVSKRKNPFGDGKAADRIFSFLKMGEIESFINEYPKSYDFEFSSCDDSSVTFKAGADDL